jgi:hypothetical protein
MKLFYIFFFQPGYPLSINFLTEIQRSTTTSLNKTGKRRGKKGIASWGHQWETRCECPPSKHSLWGENPLPPSNLDTTEKTEIQVIQQRPKHFNTTRRLEQGNLQTTETNCCNRLAIHSSNSKQLPGNIITLQIQPSL